MTEKVSKLDETYKPTDPNHKKHTQGIVRDFWKGHVHTAIFKTDNQQRPIV